MIPHPKPSGIRGVISKTPEAYVVRFVTRFDRMHARTILSTFTLLTAAAGCGLADGDSDDGAGTPTTDEITTTQAPSGADVIPGDESITTQAPGGEGVVPNDQVTTTLVPVADGPEPTCTYMGTAGMFDYMEVELEFTNPLGEVTDLEVTYALLDGEAGSRFFTGSAGGLDMVWIMFPAANEQFRLSVDTRADLPPSVEESTITCAVLAIEEGLDIGGNQRASEADSCEVVGEDSSGKVQVELSVTSPFEETMRIQTWWALQAPGPVTFASDTEVVDLVGAGERFKIVPRFGTDKPEWIGDDEVTCAVLGFWGRSR
jgi:hypothetical protein